MKLCIIQVVVASILWSISFFGNHDLYAQIPLVTVRFVNPGMNCTTSQYCVDVEFKSDTLGVELFGMNVRLFYDESVLEFVNFTNFQGGYNAVSPNPPQILTGSSSSGPDLFNFVGAAEFVNGAIQLTNASAPDIILDDWEKIFQICFTVDSVGDNPDHFCPSIVWDLEQDPSNGGFFTGDDGVVITVVHPDPGIESSPADEAVEHLNWHYIGSGSPPYGEPDTTQCISAECCPVLPVLPNDTICDGDQVVFEYVDEVLDSVTYSWNFGSGSNPSTASGPGPHVIEYDTTATNQVLGAEVSLTMDMSGCTQVSGQVSTIVVNAMPDASFAPGDDTLCYYTDKTLIPLAGVISGATYFWTFGEGAVPPSAFGYGPHTVYYQSIGIKTVKLIIDPDAPGAECADSSTQTFEIIECPGNISGTVFVDLDGDQIPESGEGIANVEIKLHLDVNMDGIADSGDTVATTMTSETGSYSLNQIPIGNYILTETTTDEYTSLKDYDLSNDEDSVSNLNLNNDTIPVTIMAGEQDAHNYFIDAPLCPRFVTNTDDGGDGSLRNAILCAVNGDTIKFHHSLAGQVILISSTRLVIDADIIIWSNLVPNVKIKSSIPGLFDIGSSATPQFRNLQIVSGIDGYIGSAFNNLGHLILHDVQIDRNPGLSSGHYLIHNMPGSQSELRGICRLE